LTKRNSPDMKRALLTAVIPMVLLLRTSWTRENSNPETAKRAYEIRRLENRETIQIDGLLDETAWEGAAVATDFITKIPRERETATQKSEVRMLYDDKNIGSSGFLVDRPDTFLRKSRIEA
jgi:hypothetical protein